MWQCFLCVCFCCCYYGSYSRILVEHLETSNNLNLKNTCIFFMYMGNGFQTVYFFCKELHLRSYKVPRTSFSSFSQQFQVLIDLLYHLSIQVSLELEKAMSEKQCLWVLHSSFRSTNKKRKTFWFIVLLLIDIPNYCDTDIVDILYGTADSKSEKSLIGQE